ncbi:hypothetical protein ACNTMW_31910 [Planosporangium sp. 12N6]
METFDCGHPSEGALAADLWPGTGAGDLTVMIADNGHPGEPRTRLTR